MHKNLFFLFFLVLSLASSGCESMGSNTKKGVGFGAVLGSVTGGVVGHQSGRGVEGAVIGGALGAGAGALIGSGMDDQAKKDVPSTQASISGSMTILKVVDMVKQGVPDSIVIDEIQKTGSKFSLDTQTIQYLKDNQVSDQLIDTMLKNK